MKKLLILTYVAYALLTGPGVFSLEVSKRIYIIGDGCFMVTGASGACVVARPVRSCLLLISVAGEQVAWIFLRHRQVY